jgi:large subunit ribosomal protein L30
MAQIKVTLVRSVIERPETQKRTVKSLGLGKVNSSVVRQDSPQIMGMVKKVSHLIKVENI